MEKYLTLLIEIITFFVTEFIQTPHLKYLIRPAINTKVGLKDLSKKSSKSKILRTKFCFRTFNYSNLLFQHFSCSLKTTVFSQLHDTKLSIKSLNYMKFRHRRHPNLLNLQFHEYCAVTMP